MTGADLSARALIDSLSESGITQLVLAPGSRSAPLVYAAFAAAARGRIGLTVRLDERSAAFTALGLAAASSQPAGVITTSGTAGANLHPAVMEAAAGRVPLIAITADRPAELQNVGANQTWDQRCLFGRAPVWQATIEADADPSTIAIAARQAVEAALGARSSVAGPAHINIRFREPLVPDAASLPCAVADQAGSRRSATAPDAVASPSRAGEMSGKNSAETDRPAQLDALRLDPGPRTVVLAGYGAGPAARKLAEAASWPLIAEPASGSWGGPNLVPAGRLVARLLGATAERVVVYGRPVLSRDVLALATGSAEVIVVHSTGGPWFGQGNRARLLAGRVDLNGHGTTIGPEWLDSWLELGRAIWARVAAQPWPSGAAVAAAVAEAAGQGPLVVGASNAIRDLGLVAPRAQQPLVYSMRGLGGIDGTVSYAAGIALALDRPTHLLLGDLSLMHDSGGLAIPALEARPLLRIVLMNDSGGGIFETLEPARADLAETFERFFAVPHSISFQKLAAAVGVGYQRADSAEDLAGALRRPISGLELVEVALDRSTRRDFEQRLLAEASTEDPIPSQFT